MATPEETFEQTMKTKAVLDLYRAYKLFQDLLENGVDRETAFLQAFMGVYYLVPPVPRPDYAITQVGDLYDAVKESHVYLAQLLQESKDALAFLEAHMNGEKLLS